MNKNKFKTGNVLTIAVTHFIHDVFTAFQAPLNPYIQAKFGLNLTQIGFLDFIRRIPAIFNPIIGLLADNLPFRYLVIITPAITATLMSLIGIIPTYGYLAITLFAVGLSSALFHVPAPVMMKRVSGKKTGKGMSFFMLGGEGSRTAGPIIITWFATNFGFENTYKLIPFGIVISFILYFKLRNIDISSDIKKKFEKKTDSVLNTLKKYLPFFLILTGFIGSRAFAKSSLMVYLNIYLKNEGASLWFANSSLAILQFAGALGTILAGTVSDYLGRKKTLIIAGIIMPLCFLLFIYTSGIYGMIAVFLTGFFLFASGPVTLAYVQDIPSDRPAFINSLYMTINFFISAPSVLLVGYIADQTSLRTMFIITLIVSVLAIPFAFLIKKIPKK